MKKSFALFLSLALVFSLSAGLVFAAVDKGKDGVDQDCKDFKWQQLAQRYFVADGGSKARNVDGLDADHDGIACETLPKAKPLLRLIQEGTALTKPAPTSSISRMLKRSS